MEANQITVRLEDEEYVRSVWVGVSYCSREETNSCCGPTVFIAPFLSGNKWTGEFRAETKVAAFSAAAEYTREQLEQVRQRREEIALIERVRGYMATDSSAQPIIAFRIKARLEAELTTLTRGMKPEALEGATR